jgi:hypothetical protein
MLRRDVVGGILGHSESQLGLIVRNEGIGSSRRKWETGGLQTLRNGQGDVTAKGKRQVV